MNSLKLFDQRQNNYPSKFAPIDSDDGSPIRINGGKFTKTFFFVVGMRQSTPALELYFEAPLKTHCCCGYNQSTCYLAPENNKMLNAIISVAVTAR